MTGLLNPLAYQIDEEDLKLKYAEPYSDLHSLPKEKLEAFIEAGAPVVRSHLDRSVGRSVEAGFSLTHLFEDGWGGNHVFDQYFQRAFMATRAVKPN